MSLFRCFGVNPSLAFILLQAETLKQKLGRAAQFSRAGLIVPEELSLLFKKDAHQKDSENSEVSEKVSPHRFVDPTIAKECNRNLTGSGRKSKNVIENDAMKPVECKQMVDVVMSNPEPISKRTFDLSDMMANSTIEPSVPTCDEIDLQVNYISTVFMYLDDFCEISDLSIATRGCCTSEFTHS